MLVNISISITGPSAVYKMDGKLQLKKKQDQK